MKITEAMREEGRAMRKIAEEGWAEFVAGGYLERSRVSWGLSSEREEHVYRLGWEVGYLAALAHGAKAAEALMREAAQQN